MLRSRQLEVILLDKRSQLIHICIYIYIYLSPYVYVCAQVNSGYVFLFLKL